MRENLLDRDLDSRKLRLLEEADSFDLEDFYLGRCASSGGVCLITENQMLMTECYIKRSMNSSYGMHIDTVDDIYKAIYGINDFKNVREGIWQDRVVGDGNILIQLCTNKFSNLIWLPEEITSEQFEMLKTFSNRINIIIRNHLEYFKENPLIFECRIGKENLLLTVNGIQDILESVKVREVKNESRVY